MIPLWLKLAYTIFVAIVVPVYAKKWGWGNFLWFSDIALLLMVPALWLESRLLVSMITVGVLFPEAFWNLSFFVRLITGKRIGGLTDYMFDAEKPLWLRALSLFHVFLPVLSSRTCVTIKSNRGQFPGNPAILFGLSHPVDTCTSEELTVFSGSISLFLPVCLLISIG
jgi:hypothetical protein